MIFKKLELFNFGVYCGRHSINLAPKRRRPIILIGGLNGRGKTTLIDAFQLVLFGKFAKCSNRKGLPYEQFLSESINNQVSKLDGAKLSLELELRHQNQLASYSITRTWNARQERVNEHVEVTVNGTHDPVLSESWEQFIQQIIPQEISEFVFFDGEKIEQLAEPNENKNLVKVGVRSLLGINLVSDLVSDLRHLPQRHKRQQKEGHALAQGAELESLGQGKERLQLELSSLERHHSSIIKEMGALQVNIDNINKSLAEARKRYQDIGGETYEKRNLLDAERRLLETKRQELIHTYVNLAEGSAPLGLIAPIVQRIVDDAARACEVKQNMQVVEFSETRDAKILNYLEGKFNADMLNTVREVQTKTLPELNTDIPDYLRSINVEGLRDFDMESTIANLKVMESLSGQIDTCRNKLEKIERQLNSLSDDDEVLQLHSSINESEKAHMQLSAKMELLQTEKHGIGQRIKDKQRRLYELHREIAKASAQSNLEEMMIEHIPKLVETLERFKEASAKRSVHKIEKRVVECFDQLVGKADLLKDVCIDPKTFFVTLTGPQGAELPISRLSAGERQLLAIAFIWALSSNAPTPLPAVIDTPLGRLDSVHREILLTKYFPNAAAQVLLLSTDEEIDTKAYSIISPYLAHEYSLIFDNQRQSSSVVDGYEETLEKKVA